MSTLTSTPLMGTIDTRNLIDSERILAECCTQNASCRFQLVHSGYSAHSVFESVHPEGIDIRISLEESNEPLLPQAVCCVSFPYRTTFCSFLGVLIDIRHLESGERRVIASVPQQLTTTTLRQSFRVPVIMGSGLEVIVGTSDKKKFVVRANDVAEAGIEIEFPSGERPALSVGSIVDVELRFRDVVIQRTGEVRRVVGPRCGLLFLNQDKEDHRLAARMSGIVVALQQLWLKNRLK